MFRRRSFGVANLDGLLNTYLGITNDGIADFLEEPFGGVPGSIYNLTIGYIAESLL
jgi:hypothetical protein